MTMREQTCCFTGHRMLPKKVIPALEQRLEEEILRLFAQGVRFFGAGGALGFDTLAAEAVLRLRPAHPALRLILVLPCKNQAARWREEDRLRYESILKQADKVVYTSEEYGPGCMHRRNRYLAENSGHCLCYLTKTSGGTWYTVNCCRANGASIRNLAYP